MGGGHPFVGPWGTKGLYAYKSGKYSGMAFFGTGGIEIQRLSIPHESDKYRPWNRYDPDIPAHIRKKLIDLEDDDTIKHPVKPLHNLRTRLYGWGGSKITECETGDDRSQDGTNDWFIHRASKSSPR